MKLLLTAVLLCFTDSLVHYRQFRNGHLYSKSFIKKPYHPKFPIKKNPTVYFNPPDSKIDGLIQLIRPKSILPTFLLSFSGGWLMHPSLTFLAQSTPFLISSLTTLLVMSSAMVINDIYDLPIDRINHPKRPLVSKTVSVPEAIALYVTMILITEGLSLYFLPSYLQNIIHLAIIYTGLYTPVFKKIPFVKNAACAGLVSFSIFFSGLSSTSRMISLNPNFELFSNLLVMIFLGSFCNELLLDIRDYEGDKENQIYTIPVIFGKPLAWVTANMITYFNLFFSGNVLIYHTNLTDGLLMALMFSPILKNLYWIKQENYSYDSITRTLNDSNITLFSLILFFCSIAFTKT
jgi:geranylgeranylglycerol-phosphate geranylgeranyltransferase